MPTLLIVLFVLVALLLIGASVTVYESRRNAVHHKHRATRGESDA